MSPCCCFDFHCLFVAWDLTIPVRQCIRTTQIKIIVCRTRSISYAISSSWQACKAGIIIPILQERKLRGKEDPSARGLRARKWQNRVQPQLCLVPNPLLVAYWPLRHRACVKGTLPPRDGHPHWCHFKDEETKVQRDKVVSPK